MKVEAPDALFVWAAPQPSGRPQLKVRRTPTEHTLPYVRTDVARWKGLIKEWEGWPFGGMAPADKMADELRRLVEAVEGTNAEDR